MIYAIGDLHLDHTKEKSMDIFGENWIDHEEQIFENWKENVKEEDIVLLPGDISWALKPEEVYNDLKRIDDMPGKKIMIKGNHDYWWQSLKKLKDMDFKTIDFIQNDACEFNNIGIYGTRGWNPRDTDGFTEQDEKIFLRELNRLELSLKSLEKKEKKIVMLHYPPFNINSSSNEFVDIMNEYDVDICLYGHLHADGHKYIIEGNIRDIEFYCVSSDYINFKLRQIDL